MNVTDIMKGFDKTGLAATLRSQSGDPLASLGSAGRGSAPAGAGGSFKDILDEKQKAEKAAGDLVSNALILPMLKQVRRSPWGQNTVFSGGIGEKTFGPEFDMQIADRIAHSPQLPIKAALASRLLKTKTPDSVKLSEAYKLDAHG